MKLVIIISVLFLSDQLGATTIDDVLEAVKDLAQYSLQKQGELHLLMNEQSAILRNELNKIQDTTIQEITYEIDKIQSKIQFIAQTLKETTGTSINTTTEFLQKEIDSFVYQLTEKFYSCYGSLLDYGNYKLYSIWNEVWLDYDFGYNCINQTVTQCQNYETKDCIENSMRLIELSKMKTTDRYGLFKTNMVNAITGINIPCRGMILQELNLFSSHCLKIISQCAELTTAISFDLSC